MLIVVASKKEVDVPILLKHVFYTKTLQLILLFHPWLERNTQAHYHKLVEKSF
jgi:hypothetical protein